MTTETNHAPTTGTEPGNSWSGYKEPIHDDPPNPEPGQPEPEPEAELEPEPDALPALAEQDSPAPPQSEQESAVAPAPLHDGGDPLLTAEAESDLLSRWTEIQVSFVEDPGAAVQNADTLIHEIATTLLASFEERRSELAAAWQNGQPDTEQLRLALRQYRSFVGVVLSG